MALRATYWERRDNADREALGNTAYDFCRALRRAKGMRNCRYYWTNAVEFTRASPDPRCSRAKT